MTPEGKAAFVAWMQSSAPQYIVLVDKGHYGGWEAWDAIAQAAIDAHVKDYVAQAMVASPSTDKPETGR